MPAQPQKKARPKEFTGLLPNPHKGCATFQRFNGDALFDGTHWSESGPTEFPPRKHEGVTPGYLPCTVAYCRWFWDLFEPEQGKYDWSMVEKALATARERGQTLQVRLMPHGSSRQPKVPQWYRDRYPTQEKMTHKAPPPTNVPIYDSPEYIDKWGAVVTEFGRRFDGHPQLESVDVSFIGPWGEGAGECSEDAIDTITQIYVDAHAKTPLMTMISGYKMEAGVKAGMGWRLDCFGDLGIFDNPNLPKEKWWMHHFDCYPKEVCVCGAQDAWKNGPITFESCGVPMHWYEKGFDLDFILQQGYKFHGTVFMPKSAKIPDEYIEPLTAFCDRIGYRYVLRQVHWDARPEQGGSFGYTAWVENVGVAPLYHRYDFALRLTQGNRTHVHRSPADVKTWLPGDVWLEETVELPETFGAGSVMLHAALVSPETGEPGVRLANEGADADGWLPLDTIEIM
ncbi:MAG TPA: DUF4832 domain-containing protein [Planctomycetota bacterium]|nr:DUF4832 domain-containing protein [Planctomycetota bacterium]